MREAEYSEDEEDAAAEGVLGGGARVVWGALGTGRWGGATVPRRRAKGELETRDPVVIVLNELDSRRLSPIAPVPPSAPTAWLTLSFVVGLRGAQATAG